MRQTTVHHPDGTVTRIESRSSLGCVTLFLALFVVAAPATFATPWNVLAYVVVGLLAVGCPRGLAQSAPRRPDDVGATSRAGRASPAACSVVSHSRPRRKAHGCGR